MPGSVSYLDHENLENENLENLENETLAKSAFLSFPFSNYSLNYGFANKYI